MYRYLYENMNVSIIFLYNCTYASQVQGRMEVIMKGKLNSNLGDVYIDSAVIAKCAGITAIECFGIVGMAAVSMADGIVKLLKRDSLAKGINVEVNEKNEVTLNFHVIVAYGVSISAVADNLISNVQYQVEEITGLTVKKINIYVESVRVID